MQLASSFVSLVISSDLGHRDNVGTKMIQEGDKLQISLIIFLHSIPPYLACSSL